MVVQFLPSHLPSALIPILLPFQVWKLTLSLHPFTTIGYTHCCPSSWLMTCRDEGNSSQTVSSVATNVFTNKSVRPH